MNHKRLQSKALNFEYEKALEELRPLNITDPSYEGALKRVKELAELLDQNRTSRFESIKLGVTTAAKILTIPLTAITWMGVKYVFESADAKDIKRDIESNTRMF